MRKLKILWERFARYLDLDHDQRKQFATMCNTVAALLMVNYYIHGSGFTAVVMLFASVTLWVISIVIVRKKDDKEDK
jgi:hypothetical protein